MPEATYVVVVQELQPENNNFACHQRVASTCGAGRPTNDTHFASNYEITSSSAIINTYFAARCTLGIGIMAHFTKWVNFGLL
jgi:hypothetical protein